MIPSPTIPIGFGHIDFETKLPILLFIVLISIELPLLIASVAQKHIKPSRDFPYWAFISLRPA